MENGLQKFVTENNIEVADFASIAEAFGAPFEEAGVVLATYKDIEVVSETQTAEMKKAKELRLILKKTRTTIENNRKKLKADALKQGRAIDAIARYVKEQIEPAENYLQSQEDFVKLQEQARVDALVKTRLEAIAPYGADPSLYKLEEMTDEQFSELVQVLKASEEARLQAEAETEKKRIADAEEAERLRAENAKLREEADRRDAEAEHQRVVEANEKALAQKQAEEAELAAKSAPDKEKIIAFAQQIRGLKPAIPVVTSQDAQNIVKTAEQALANVYGDLVRGAGTL